MKVKRYDNQKLGIAIGIVGPFFGFLLYGLAWATYFARSFGEFYTEIFVAIPTFRAGILTLSLLFNLIPFFFFIRTHRYKSARGVLLAVFLYIPLVVYYRFFN